MTPNWSFETRQIHAGQTPDPTTKARALPIYQTTSYAFDSSEHGRKLFALEELGNIYTRIMNPTQAVVEDRINSLEGGVGALLVASGQSAETLAILNIAEAGDHIVSSPRLYGGTYNLFHYTLPKLGITVDFVENPDDPASWPAAAKPNTKAFYAESISNPQLDVLDFRAIADVAHAVGVPLIVDNTVPTPYLIRPIEHGADIVVHSATKYLGGHGTAIGGVIVDSGNFDWVGERRTVPELQHPGPQLQQPDLGRRPRPGRPVQVERRVHLQGPAAGAARHRPGHLAVQRLPDLAGHRDAVAADRAAHRQRHQGRGVAERPGRGRVGVLPRAGVQPVARQPAQVRAARAAARSSRSRSRAGSRPAQTFTDALELFTNLANIGDVRSLVIHPASTTHAQLSPAEQLTTGVTPGLIRLAVGIEHIDDILADLEAGFTAAKSES